jgi:hypothetical protein
MLRGLKTLTFVYVPREDRVVAAINAGQGDAWSCWLTRRLALGVLERTSEYLQSKSDLAQRAPANLRTEMIAFERDAAIAETAGAMSITPPAILEQSATAAELAERLTITPAGESFRLELFGLNGAGAAALFKLVELQRMLQMLQAEVAKAGWLLSPAKPQTPAESVTADPKPSRH